MDVLDEVRQHLSIFKNLYDIIRIIDPINKKIVASENLNEFPPNIACYKFWGKDRMCENCISLRALAENDTFVKIEQASGNIYLTISSPVELKDKVYIVELLKDITANGLNLKVESSVVNKVDNLIVKLNDAYIKDSLTNLYNKRYLKDNLFLNIEKSYTEHTPLSVIMLDIDFFKNINDLYGHLAGDYVLKEFAALITKSLRKSTDWVARYGGEEFFIVLNNTDVDGAYNVAEKIKENLCKTNFHFEQHDISFTASFGLYTMDSEKKTVDELIELADKNLYDAKKNGRNKIVASCSK